MRREGSSAREPGFSDDSSINVALVPGSIAPGSTVEYAQPTSAISSIGINAIMKKVGGQMVEFPTNQYPNTYEVVNRAQKGNVKIWAQGFDSVMYPEGATDDRTTWLQPGDKMVLSKDAVFHFFGNLFHPTKQGAIDVIEACGGFELEAKSEFISDAKGVAPARIVGGPLFLPDFIITPIDGRGRVVGTPFALYDEYDKLTRSMRKNSILPDGPFRESQWTLLQDRLAEYREADASIFDQYGNPIEIEAPPEPCDCFPIAHAKGVPGCQAGEVTERKKRTKEPEQEPAAV